MPFKKYEDTFAHGINIPNNFQSFNLLSASKLFKKLVGVNYSPILKYTFLNARLAPNFA